MFNQWPGVMGTVKENMKIELSENGDIPKQLNENRAL